MLKPNLKSIVQSNVENLAGDLENKAKGLKSNLINSAVDSLGLGSAGGLLKALLGGPSSQPQLKTQVKAGTKQETNDWRVKLSIPSTFGAPKILEPLVATNGLVFPYTPTILIQHTANYDALLIAWDAYSFPSWTGSGCNFGTSTYSLGTAAETARTSLITKLGLPFIDGGGV